MDLLKLLEALLKAGGEITITLKLPSVPPAPAPEQQQTAATTPAPGAYPALCPHCGWTRSYASPVSAKRGLNGHFAHCHQLNRAWAEDLPANGRK